MSIALLLDAPLNDEYVNLGDELITNGDFETGDPPDSWLSSNGIISSVAEERTGGSGVSALKLEATGTYAGAYQKTSSALIGRTYFLSIWNKYISGSDGSGVAIYTYTGFWSIPYRGLKNTDWANTIIYTFRAPTTAIKVELKSSFKEATEGTAYFDDVSLREYWLSDLSPNARHLSPAAEPTWNTLASGLKVMNFNGTTDLIDIGSDFIGTKAVTVEAWIRPETAGENSAGFIINNNKFTVALDNTNARVSVTSDSSTVVYSGTSAWAANTWKHLVVTRTDAGVANIYINGVLSGSANQASGTPAAGTTNVFIGNRSAADRTFDGDISMVRVYDGIMSPSAILARYSAMLPMYTGLGTINTAEKRRCVAYNMPTPDGVIYTSDRRHIAGNYRGMPIILSLSDSSYGSDATLNIATFVNSLTDVSLSSDITLIINNIILSASDASSSSDTTSNITTFVNSLSDTSISSDIVASLAALLPSLTDGASGSDSTKRGTEYTNTATDAATGSDTVGRAYTAIPTAYDGCKASDIALSLAALGVSVNDIAHASDSPSSLASLLLSLADSGVMSDTTMGGLLYMDALSDSHKASDTLRILLAAIPVINDSTRTSDFHSVIANFVPHMQDAAKSSDILSTRVIFINVVRDESSASDVTSVKSSLFLNMADASVLSDTIIENAAMMVEVSESTNTSDLVDSMMRAYIEATENATASDVTTGGLVIPITLTEGATISDVMSLIAQFVESLDESMIASDTTGLRRTNYPVFIIRGGVYMGIEDNKI